MHDGDELVNVVEIVIAISVGVSSPFVRHAKCVDISGKIAQAQDPVINIIKVHIIKVHVTVAVHVPGRNLDISENTMSWTR